MAKPSKRYRDNEIRQAVFRISHGQWEGFQGICQGQNKSASEVIVSLIDACIASGSIPDSIEVSSQDIDALVDAKLAGIKAELQGMIDDAIKLAIGSSSPMPVKPIKKSKPRVDNANQLKQIADMGCLTSTQLADRLGIDRTVLSRMNSGLDANQFKRYCSERDPEGKAWEKLTDKIGRYAVYKQIDS